MIWCIILSVDSKDILNIVLIIGILITSGCLIYITIHLVRTLKAITSLAGNLEETAKDLGQLRGSLKMKALATVPALLAAILGKFVKRR